MNRDFHWTELRQQNVCYSVLLPALSDQIQGIITMMMNVTTCYVGMSAKHRIRQRKQIRFIYYRKGVIGIAASHNNNNNNNNNENNNEE